LRSASIPSPDLPHIPQAETIWSSDRLGAAYVTVIVPLYNYAAHIVEALDSVAAQTLQAIDLVVIDDCSTDDGPALARQWLERHGARFNRALLLRNRENSGLGLTRNAGFDAAETPFVLPLDADNRLLPKCAESCLRSIKESGAAFAYPQIQKFGELTEVIGDVPYDPVRFIGGNFIDAMALVAKPAWASVGGYDHVRFGWEDYDFWCRLVEHGFWGQPVPEILAEYRVHAQSMLRTVTEAAENKRRLLEDMERRHPWLRVAAVTAIGERRAMPSDTRRPEA
jgi:glycosyltransferase involved in cell wall biosynthesis